MTNEQISAFCLDRLSEILRIPRDSIDPRAKFNRLGLDSAMTVYLLMDLEERLNLELAPEAFYDHPTVEALSAFLADQHAVRYGAAN